MDAKSHMKTTNRESQMMFPGRRSSEECAVGRRRRARRSVVVALTAAFAVFASVGVAGAAPEDGLLEADDLSGQWEETPADGVADFATTIEPAVPICEPAADLIADGDVTPVDGPTFTQDGQEVSSYVLDVGAKLAKRVIKTFKKCGSKPAAGVGKNSATWSAPQFEETADGELTVTSDLYFVLARVGSTLGVYEATGDGTEVDKKDINKAVKAALKRLTKGGT